MAEYLSPILEDASKRYFMYAKCQKTVNKTNGTGVFLLSETAIAMEAETGYYHFLVGLLNSEYEDERSFATMYGYTEVLPGRITTDKIVSSDNTNYWDMVANRFRIGNDTRYMAWNVIAGLLEIKNATLEMRNDNDEIVARIDGDNGATILAKGNAIFSEDGDVDITGGVTLVWDGDDTKPVNRIAAVDRSSENEKTKVIITPQAIRSINNITGNETFPQVVVNGAASSQEITTGNHTYTFNNITLAAGKSYDLVIPAISLAASWDTASGVSGSARYFMYMDNTTTGSSILITSNTANPSNTSVSFSQSVTVNGLQAGIWRLRIALSIIGVGGTASYSIPAGATYSLRPIVEATEIGNNGICSIFTTINWFHATTDGFVVRMGDVGFRITTNGIQKSSNMGVTTPTWTNM